MIRGWSVVLKAQKHVAAVLFVDDGSTDASAEIAHGAGAKIIAYKIKK